MSFSPDLSEQIARTRSDLRMGVPIVLLHAAGHFLCMASETLSEKRMIEANELSSDTCLVITSRRAETLKARSYDGDLARLCLPRDVSLHWIQDIADPANDLSAPMKGPFKSLRGGDVAAHRLAIHLAKSARLLPTVLMTPIKEGVAFAQAHNLTALPAELALREVLKFSQLNDIVHARLPIEVSEAGRLHVFRPENGAEEHYAMEVGAPDRTKPVLARLHSACFTGDVMGSLKCDCGPQLRGALAQMGTEGAGVLLYLNQEGRGIGLANKMRAYSLQDQGFDTVEANHRLGFEDDERDFRIGSDILRSLGFSSVRLLTNNPAKIAMMEKTGIFVEERVPLIVGETAFNQDYLATKARKSGHLF